MTDDNFKERPSLEEICRKCVHFQSETDSTDEINKLVDYYFGTNLEVCTIVIISKMDSITCFFPYRMLPILETMKLTKLT